MTIRLATATRNAMADALAAQINAGSGPGYVEVRTGSQPATPNTAATGTLLATVTLDDPATGSASSGTITLAGLPDSDVSADATGTAGWFRLFDSTGAAVVDGSCSGVGGGGDLVFDNPSFVAGQTVSIVDVSSFTVPVG